MASNLIWIKWLNTSFLEERGKVGGHEPLLFPLPYHHIWLFQAKLFFYLIYLMPLKCDFQKSSCGSWLPEEKKANMWHGRDNSGGSWPPPFPREGGNPRTPWASAMQTRASQSCSADQASALQKWASKCACVIQEGFLNLCFKFK